MTTSRPKSVRILKHETLVRPRGATRVGSNDHRLRLSPIRALDRHFVLRCPRFLMNRASVVSHGSLTTRSSNMSAVYIQVAADGFVFHQSFIVTSNVDEVASRVIFLRAKPRASCVPQRKAFPTANDEARQGSKECHVPCPLPGEVASMVILLRAKPRTSCVPQRKAFPTANYEACQGSKEFHVPCPLTGATPES